MWSRQLNSARFVLVTLVTLVAAATATAPGDGATGSATGTLDLRARLRLISVLGACPAGVSANVCAARTGEGLLPGLGSASEAYTFIADSDAPVCEPGFGKARAYPVSWTVEGKGTIQFALAEGDTCIDLDGLRTQSQSFTIMGGTGIYAGASGGGTVVRTLGGTTIRGRLGTETWAGTLVVPGLEFDVTPPKLSGVSDRIVRVAKHATRARLRFAVTARDELDGAVPVSCRPKSGSRFKVGRTIVRCSANDRSGNTQTARFRILVKRRA
jgi:hypothetical protein